MIRILAGVFIVLHGLVHLLYFGQSARYFELQPGMTWPDGSWIFSRIMGSAAARNLAGVLLILSALVFIVGGVGIFFGQQPWRQPVVTAGSILSSLIFILFWDGVTQKLPDRGLFAILINLAITVVLWVTKAV